jgi:hypothetical protein
MTRDKGADIGDLVGAREMVPVHRGWMKGATTVRARRVGLDRAVPPNELLMSIASLTSSGQSVVRVTSAVILTPTLAAPSLATVASPMKCDERFHVPTSTTPLHVVRVDNESDGGTVS